MSMPTIIYAYTRPGSPEVVQFADAPMSIGELDCHEVAFTGPGLFPQGPQRLVGGALEPVPLSLDEAKATKREEINAARLRANQSNFTYQGKLIACDPLSRSDIDGVTSEVALTGNLPADFPGGWKAKDNSYVSIPNVAAWRSFVQAMVAQGTANFVHAQALKAAVDAATTLAEIDAVVW